MYIYGGLSATYTFVYAIEQVSRPSAANCSLQEQQHPFVNQSTSVHWMYVSCRNTGSLPSCQHDLTQYSSTDLQGCFDCSPHWLIGCRVVGCQFSTLQACLQEADFVDGMTIAKAFEVLMIVYIYHGILSCRHAARQ